MNIVYLVKDVKLKVLNTEFPFLSGKKISTNKRLKLSQIPFAVFINSKTQVAPLESAYC